MNKVWNSQTNSMMIERKKWIVINMSLMIMVKESTFLVYGINDVKLFEYEWNDDQFINKWKESLYECCIQMMWYET